jgi:hypothetical protein
LTGKKTACINEVVLWGGKNETVMSIVPKKAGEISKEGENNSGSPT